MGVDARLDSLVAGYRVERLLGRGGMGAVYLAHDVQLGRKVALKLLAPELSEDTSFRERFLRESRIAAGLEHPNVVPVYQAGDADGTLFIAMRYVEGTDLKRLLADAGRLDRATVASVASQVAAALDAAHEAGLVHRDVKPGNVLIDRREHVYLSDFGLTKQTASRSGLTATGTLVGTLDYVAPEQIQGQPVDGRSDIYSLACMLHEALTGTPPFRRDTDVATLWAHIQEPPAPTGDAAVDETFARALNKRPADRYASAGEFAGDLGRALGTSSDTIAASITEPHHPDRRLVAGAGAVVLALAAAAGVVLSSRGGPAATVTVKPFSLAMLDANSGKVVSDIPLGGTGTRAAFTPGAVWVANRDDQTLIRIDPQTRTVMKTVGLGFTASDIAATPDALWLANQNGGSVAKFDPATASEIGSTRIRTRRTNYYKLTPSVVVAGAGDVWTDAGIDEIDRIADISRVTKISSGEYAVDGLAFAAGGLWYYDERSAAVSKIDPATDRVSSSIVVGAASAPQAPLLQGLGAGRAGVWAVGLPPSGPTQFGGTDVDFSKPATLYRIDARTGGVNGAVQIGHLQGQIGNSAGEPAVALAPIAVGSTAVWVGNSRDGTLSIVDAASVRVVRTVRLGHEPLAIAADQQHLWVTVGR
jgi:YVTN family beta-propeller protein